MRAVLITGSARKDGNTLHMANALAAKTGWHVINLSDYLISPYDYDHNNTGDDFLPLMQTITAQYDTLIFATPVYWYAMSGTMKTFFDRLTDLVTIEKDLGRQLRGKKMAVISNSEGDNLGNDFWLPFIATANYLGMRYTANMHGIATTGNDKETDEFITKVNRQV